MLNWILFNVVKLIPLPIICACKYVNILAISAYNNQPPHSPPHGTLEDIEVVDVALVTTFNCFFNIFVEKKQGHY